MENNNMNTAQGNVDPATLMNDQAAAPAAPAQPITPQTVFYDNQGQTYVLQPTQKNQGTPGRGKGLAMSIVSLGLGVGGIIFALITLLLVVVFGALSASYGSYVYEETALLMNVYLFVYGGFAVGMAIPALILGSKAKKVRPTKMASAGFVLGLITVIITALCVIISLAASAR